MKKQDLHSRFIEALHRKIPHRPTLVSEIANILHIEKESVSRRLNNRVAISLSEAGRIAEGLKISLDGVLSGNTEEVWVPFTLNKPLKKESIEELCDRIDSTLDITARIQGGSAEAWTVHNSLPMEFYVHHPALMKFMFFKWGHYFVGNCEFHDFAGWEVPERLLKAAERVKTLPHFSAGFYIFDRVVVLSLVTELRNFHRMGVVREKEKALIRDDLKELLNNLENYLKGDYDSDVTLPAVTQLDFYISNLDIGLTTGCYLSGDCFMAMTQTNFAHALIDNDFDTFQRVKEWIQSLRNMSVMISASGNIERTAFFKEQHRIIDTYLG